MVSILVFLASILAPGDVFLSDNGEGWELRHLVTPAPQTETETERGETGCSARVFQMRVRGWWSHTLIILQSDQTLSNIVSTNNNQ